MTPWENRHRWDDNTEMDPKELSCRVVDLILVVQDRVHWRVVASALTYLRVLHESHLSSLVIRAIGSASKVVRILIYGNSYIGINFEVTHTLKFIMLFLVNTRTMGEEILYVTSVTYLRHKPFRFQNTICLFLRIIEK